MSRKLNNTLFEETCCRLTGSPHCGQNLPTNAVPQFTHVCCSSVITVCIVGLRCRSSSRPSRCCSFEIIPRIHIFSHSLAASSHLHVEHTAQGVVVVGIEGRHKEVGVADDVGVQRTDHAVTSTVEVGKVVGGEDLNALDAVLHELRGVAMHRDAVAVALTSHAGKGSDQSGGVVVAFVSYL